MTEAYLLTLTQNALTVALTLAAPILIVSLGVGVLVSLVQAATQINETTLSFVPKLIGVCAILIVLGALLVTTGTISFVIHPRPTPVPFDTAEPSPFWQLCILLMVTGALLVLISGLIAKPKYMWPVLVITGIIYLYNAIIMVSSPHDLTGNTDILVPLSSAVCIICLVEGLIILWLRRRQQNSITKP